MAKISPIQEREMLAKAAEGMSSAAISEWFKEAHGVNVSGAAIRLRLSRTREERGVIATAVTREALSKRIYSDLDVLESERRRCRRLATRAYNIAVDCSGGTVNAEAAELYLKTLDRLNKLVDMRLHYAGADSPGSPGEAGGSLPSDPAERARVLRALADHEERKGQK